MNLYRQKSFVKTALFVLATVLVAASLWYSNIIVEKIRKEERKKVQLWSLAIQNKAELVDYTSALFTLLRAEEEKKVKHWLGATNALVNANTDTDLGFVSSIISDNTTIPIVVLSAENEIVASHNLDSENPTDADLQRELAEMKKSHSPLAFEYLDNKKQYLYYRDSKIVRELESVLSNLINSFISETVINSASVPVLFTDSTFTEAIAFGNLDSASLATPNALAETVLDLKEANEPIAVSLSGKQHYILFKDSFLLTQLQYFPYVQLITVAIFLLIAYLMFSSFRKAEQNQVWVGMAKETAHQLGTPLSSLLAWSSVIESGAFDQSMVVELKKDVARLDTITQRFSKIGSAPELELLHVNDVVENVVNYLEKRIPKRAFIETNLEVNELILVNAPLLEWVFENLIKNAVDAMKGEGTIKIESSQRGNELFIDVKDSGSGIPRKEFKGVFQPGFTTKKRGWGLGLSLCKRIVEKYHNGRIFVKSSELGKGTVFRIVLEKQSL